MQIDPVLAATLATVVDEGTLDAAARRLHLTPSAVSQRLKTLEDQIGRRVVVRSRPVRATSAGEAVVRFARRHAEIARDAQDELGLADDGRPRLTVAVNADSLATWILDPVSRFAAAHDVEVDLLRLDQERTVDLLESGAALAAVTSRRDPVAGCRSTPLGSMTFVAVAAPAWAARWLPDGPTTAALLRAPRIDYDRLDWLAAHGVDGVDGAAAPRHLVPSTHDIARAVELGLGWALVPRPQADALRTAGRVLGLGDPTIATPLHWQHWKGGSSLLHELTETIVRAARTSLQQE